MFSDADLYAMINLVESTMSCVSHVLNLCLSFCLRGTGHLSIPDVFLGAAHQVLLLPSPWSPAVLTEWLLWSMLVDQLLVIQPTDSLVRLQYDV